MIDFKLRIMHNNVLVVDLVTNDIEKVKEAIQGYDYELDEMLSGGDDE